MAIHNGDIFPIIRTRANFKDWCPRSESKDFLNVVISGGTQIYISEPRRTGKTIFVNSTLMENDNVIGVYVDISGTTSLYGLLELLVSESTEIWNTDKRKIAQLRSLKYEIKAQYQVAMGSEEKEAVVNDFFGKCLSAIGNLAPAKSNKRVVLVLDEFQTVLDYPKSTNGKTADWFIRSNIVNKSQEYNNISIVFIGSIEHEMEKLFTDENYAFYKTTRLRLGLISQANYFEYANKRLGLVKKNIDKDVFDKIYKDMMGITLLIQKIMYDCYHIASNKEYSKISDEIYDKALSVLLTQMESFQMQKYEKLSVPQKNVVKAIACSEDKSIESVFKISQKDKVSRDYFNKAIVSLEEKRIIKKKDNRLFFKEPEFSVWATNCLAKTVKI